MKTTHSDQPSSPMPPIPVGSGSCERMEVAPGLWLDARRAVWLAAERALVVADLHLGYTWAQRRAGQLLPLTCPDNAVERLEALREAYQPKQIFLLGDIVHRALDLDGIVQDLRRLIQGIGTRCRLRAILGNHDKNLDRVLGKAGLQLKLERNARVGAHLLIHGDRCAEKSEGEGQTREGCVIMGHEHPSIRLGDGVTTAAKCPCFLLGHRLLVLPAFSLWAAGSPVTSRGVLSGMASGHEFREAIAILGDRLLRIRLGTRTPS